MGNLFFYIIIIIPVFSLAFAWFLSRNIKKKEVVSQEALSISRIIREGAMTFLHKEYKILAVFVALAWAFLFFLIGWKIALAFLFGSFFSVLCGNVGMRIATTANVRTAEAAKKSLKEGLLVAFDSGSVMGLSVVGLGLLGVTVFYLLFKDPQIIYGFGFGASGVALFARVGGGIYAKAADVGADLVGKVEAGIPEDDPRNPAVIADNVGDNVGDVAGMGADLFESYVDSIIATMVIGFLLFSGAEQKTGIVLPLFLAALGILASIAGNLIVKLSRAKKAQNFLNHGIFGASAITALLSLFAIRYMTGSLSIYWAFLAGLISGVAIGLVTEFFTSYRYKPTQKIALASQSGAATNIISGFSLGMKSTALPVVFVVLAILIAYKFAGLYGVAIAAVGMLSTLGISLATDAYGPVADNAAGIAEMSKMGKETRERAEELDSVGNTTTAIGKGFAIGSAALTALVILVGYGQLINLNMLNLLEPKVIVGLVLGGMVSFFCSALALEAVGRAAAKMVNEVRRQFSEIEGILEGTAKPDYKKCIDISTGAALKEMILPSLITILSPVIIGFVLGPAALAGFLAGAIVCGFLVAIFMANSGGAWDNAKKYIEVGNLGGKGSASHKAAVVGDTVGDPLKDTAGPSLNILIKLMTIIASIIAPFL